MSQDLLLWLASAESRRQKAQVPDPEADPQVLLECQEELMVSFFLRGSALPLPCQVHTQVASPSVPGNDAGVASHVQVVSTEHPLVVV